MYSTGIFFKKNNALSCKVRSYLLVSTSVSRFSVRVWILDPKSRARIGIDSLALNLEVLEACKNREKSSLNVGVHGFELYFKV